MEKIGDDGSGSRMKEGKKVFVLVVKRIVGLHGDN